MDVGNQDLRNAYEKWEKMFKECKVTGTKYGIKGDLEEDRIGTNVVLLKELAKNYWNAVRDILSKPIMNESYVNQLINKVQNLKPAEDILKKHGYNL